MIFEGHRSSPDEGQSYLMIANETVPKKPFYLHNPSAHNHAPTHGRGLLELPKTGYYSIFVGFIQSVQLESFEKVTEREKFVLFQINKKKNEKNNEKYLWSRDGVSLTFDSFEIREKDFLGVGGFFYQKPNFKKVSDRSFIESESETGRGLVVELGGSKFRFSFFF